MVLSGRKGSPSALFLVFAMKFVDEASLLVRSGKGGGGCVSFRREKYIPKGGPDGGDGGKGGDLLLRVQGDKLTLYDLRLQKHYSAQNGSPGKGQGKTGHSGKDLVLDVPAGTLVFEVTPEGAKTLIADLKREGQEFTVVQGGRGGKGNTHFKSATMRTPRFAQPGEPGQEKWLALELKLIADAGLIGLPNAGKSTFLSRVSAARPKIGAYPFTTLQPQLGVVQDDQGARMVIADIPGLIEGAHLGQGLGDHFLKHVQRTKVLIHLLSLEDISLEQPFAGFELVNNELKRFDPELARKKQVCVFNKRDLWPAERVLELKRLAQKENREVFCVSAEYSLGLDAVLQAVKGSVFEEDNQN